MAARDLCCRHSQQFYQLWILFPDIFSLHQFCICHLCIYLWFFTIYLPFSFHLHENSCSNSPYGYSVLTPTLPVCNKVHISHPKGIFSVKLASRRRENDDGWLTKQNETAVSISRLVKAVVWRNGGFETVMFAVMAEVTGELKKLHKSPLEWSNPINQ